MASTAAVPGAIAGEPAGFWLRFLAALIDSAILLAVFVVLAVAIDDLLVVVIFGVLIRALYTIGFWLSSGATPGKMVVGLRVVMTSGEQIEVGSAIGRFVIVQIMDLLGLIGALGYLMIAFTADKRGPHDHVAGTKVIRLSAR